jgi:hypothetical protein
VHEVLTSSLNLGNGDKGFSDVLIDLLDVSNSLFDLGLDVGVFGPNVSADATGLAFVCKEVRVVKLNLGEDQDVLEINLDLLEGQLPLVADASLSGGSDGGSALFATFTNSGEGFGLVGEVSSPLVGHLVLHVGDSVVVLDHTEELIEGECSHISVVNLFDRILVDSRLSIASGSGGESTVIGVDFLITHSEGITTVGHGGRKGFVGGFGVSHAVTHGRFNAHFFKVSFKL